MIHHLNTGNMFYLLFVSRESDETVDGSSCHNFHSFTVSVRMICVAHLKTRMLIKVLQRLNGQGDPGSADRTPSPSDWRITALFDAKVPINNVKSNSHNVMKSAPGVRGVLKVKLLNFSWSNNYNLILYVV